MSNDQVQAARGELEKRLDKAYQQLSAALANLSHENAFKGTEWSVADCLGHLAPAGGGYSRLVEPLLSQEQPRAPARSPEARWTGLKESLTKEYQRCRSVIQAASSGDQWAKPVALPDGNTRPISQYVETMVSHFEDHANQITTQIIPRVLPR